MLELLTGCLSSLFASLPLHDPLPARADPSGDGSSVPVAREAIPRAEADDGWSFTLAPYLWMYGIDGDVRVGGVESDVDVGFDDLLENLDFSLMLHGEAWRGRDWGLFLNAEYGLLSVDATAGGGDAELETELVMVELGGLLRVLDRRDDSGREHTADLLLGTRFFYLGNELDGAAIPDVERSTDFFDLIVGGRASSQLTEGFGLTLRGDLGGFDLGSSSELSWNVFGGATWELGPGQLVAGYRALHIDRDVGSTGLDAGWSGPVLGYAFGI